MVLIRLSYLSDTPLYALPWRRIEADPDTASVALRYWTRSAAQDNIDSLVKVRTSPPHLLLSLMPDC
jgi:hypothetical protein